MRQSWPLTWLVRGAWVRVKDSEQRRMYPCIAPDQGFFQRIRLIKPIRLPVAVGDAAAGGFDQGDASADVPLVARVVCEHTLVSARRHEPAFVGNRAHRPQLQAPFNVPQEPLP